MSVLSRPQFHDEATAFRFVEAEIWPEGPVCPHCGGCERISVIKPNPEKKVRHGLKFCGQCRKQFTVKVGTIFEDSHLPMTKWLQAIYLMTASKKGISAHQMHRTLEITYKTAWFLEHRIREAMASGELSIFGQGGGIVEVDETFIGRLKGASVIVIDRQVATNVEAAHQVAISQAPQPYRELGSIEGFVAKAELDGFGRAILRFRSRLNGEEIKAVATGRAFHQLESMRLSDVWQGVRVRVYGIISYRALGEIQGLDATGIEVLDQIPLPGREDIIDEHFTGGLSSEDYLAELRSA